MELEDLSDPFILELIKTFDVKGIWIHKNGRTMVVGQPTMAKRIETKKQKRERRKRFLFLQKQRGVK